MSTFIYKSGTITVNNAQPGQRIAIKLVPMTSQVSWSTGNPATINNSGIALSAPQGAPVPVQSFSVTSQDLTVLTSSASSGGTGTLSVNITFWLAGATGIQMFNIYSSSDPGVQVMFNLDGQTQTPLTATQSTILWPN